MHRAAIRPAPGDGHLERVDDELGAHVIGHRPADDPAAQRVYLDQNDWVHLSKALNGTARSPAEADAGAMILASVQAGQASYPLSTAHLHETRKRRRADSRLPLARTMARISKHPRSRRRGSCCQPNLTGRCTLASADPLIRCRCSCSAGASRISPAARRRRSIPSSSGRLREHHPVLTVQDLTDVIDALLLSGPAADLPFGDIKLPPLQVAEEFAEAQQAQLDLFADSDQDERRRAVAVIMLRDILKPLQEATVRAGVTVDAVMALGAYGLTDFMLDLPSRAGLLELAWQQHANDDTLWQANDLNDLVFLSVAIGYCDIVVTERRGRHMFNRSPIGKRPETLVLSRLADLPQALIRASATS